MSSVPRHSEEELRQQWAFLDALVDRQAASLKSGIQDPEDEDLTMPMVSADPDVSRGDLHPDPAGHDPRGRADDPAAADRSLRGGAHGRRIGSSRGRGCAPCGREGACGGTVRASSRLESTTPRAPLGARRARGRACTEADCGEGRSGAWRSQPAEGDLTEGAPQELVAANQGVTAPAGFGRLPCAIPTN